MPLYLATPDSLGDIAVEYFLALDSSKAQKNLLAMPMRSHKINAVQKEFLLGLNALVQGRFMKSKERLANLKKMKLSKMLRACFDHDVRTLLYLMGFEKEAEADWVKTLNQTSPVSEGAWRNLFSIYMSHGRTQQANALMEKALQYAPKNKWAVQAKGYLLKSILSEEELGNYLLQQSSWQDSLFEIQIAYGRFLKSHKQYDDAIKYFNRGLEGVPKNGPAWLDLAEVYYHVGYYAFAEKCIIAAFEAGISDPFVYELYAQVLCDYGVFMDLRKAQKILEEGLPKDPLRRKMAQLLYYVYAQNGKVKEAKNLRAQLWFHFEGLRPEPLIKKINLGFPEQNKILVIHFSEISFPLVWEQKFMDYAPE